MSIWEWRGRKKERKKERQMGEGGNGEGEREEERELWILENWRDSSTHRRPKLMTWKINPKDTHAKIQSKCPNFTISNTRDLGWKSLGMSCTKLGARAAVQPLKTLATVVNSQGEAFWSPDFLTQILTLAFSFHIILRLGDCRFFPNSLPRVNKLLPCLCQPQALCWGEQGNAWKRAGDSHISPLGIRSQHFPRKCFSRNPTTWAWVACPLGHMPSICRLSYVYRTLRQTSSPVKGTVRVRVCCEQSRSLHGPGTGTSQFHSRTMWHWQGYSLGRPPAGASGDTSLEWLQRLSLGWLSPSLRSLKRESEARAGG